MCYQFSDSESLTGPAQLDNLQVQAKYASSCCASRDNCQQTSPKPPRKDRRWHQRCMRWKTYAYTVLAVMTSLTLPHKASNNHKAFRDFWGDTPIRMPPRIFKTGGICKNTFLLCAAHTIIFHQYGWKGPIHMYKACLCWESLALEPCLSTSLRPGKPKCVRPRLDIAVQSLWDHDTSCDSARAQRIDWGVHLSVRISAFAGKVNFRWKDNWTSYRDLHVPGSTSYPL